MYTLDNLPAHGHLYVFVTCDRVTDESAAEGEAEESGWIDWDWSSRTIFDSSNDVRPLVSIPLPLTDDDREDILSRIGEVSAAWEGDDGTYYAADSDIDYVTGDDYRYAVHVYVKHSTARGYVESPVSVEL